MTTQLTMEQKRANDAWKCSERFGKDEVNAAKSLPALIMNSGLMQVLAFCNEKKGAYGEVAMHLRRWLNEQSTGKSLDPGFSDFMEFLLNATPADYQAVTTEAFAWLRWLRQMAPARVVHNGSKGY